MKYSDYFKNRPELKMKRGAQRVWLTKAEYVFWQEIRKKKLGYKFRRQFSIGSFIVDFYCHEARLIIEVDGTVHESQKEYDRRRDKWLESKGCTVVRFSNDDVLFHRERVLFEIQEICGRLIQIK